MTMNKMPQNMLGMAMPDRTAVNIPESIIIVLLSKAVMSDGGTPSAAADY